MKFLALALSLVVTLISQPSLAAGPADATEQLHGTWQVTQKDQKFEAAAMIFDGQTVTMVFKNGPKEDRRSLKISVDAQPRPAHIDFISDRETSPGIFELSGDNLKICFGTGAARPTEFKSSDQAIFITLKRDKP
jgi:uncharacterized protein (TIGR03067 family)